MTQMAQPSRPAARWLTPALGVASLLTLALGLVLTFLAPPDYQMGYLSRALPAHVATAWLAYEGFAVTLACSLAYLVTRRFRFDRLALASAEVGLVFLAFGTFTGAMWAKPTWGVYWVWDPRVTTTALLLAVYVGYFMVRGLIEDPARRARVSAVIGVVAAVGVPINYMSVYWWRGLHQTATLDLTTGHSYLAGNPQLAAALWVSFVGFNLLYLYLLRYRAQIARLQAEREERDIEMELSGPAGLKRVTS